MGFLGALVSFFFPAKLRSPSDRIPADHGLAFKWCWVTNAHRPLAQPGRPALPAAGRPVTLRLRLLRALALLVGLALAVALAAGMAVYYPHLAQDCFEPGAACAVGPEHLPTRAEVEAFLPVPAYAALVVGLEVVFAAGHFLLAAALIWRAPGNPLALLGALFLTTWGASATDAFYALDEVQPGWAWLTGVISLLGTFSFFLFFSLFPSGRFAPRWTRLLVLVVPPVVWLLENLPAEPPPDASAPTQLRYLTVLLGAALGAVALLVAVVAAQVYRYFRISSPEERQQTKWVVFGLAKGVLGWLAVIIPTSILGVPEPRAAWSLALQAAYYGLLLLIPISLGAAILKARLWDIDLIIRRTLVYGFLTALLVGIYLASGVALNWLLARATGTAPTQLVTVLSTLTLAGVAGPLRKRIQIGIDRRFYRRHYSASRTLVAFGATLRDEVDLDALDDRLLAVVNETMQPAHLSLWVRPETEAAAAGGFGALAGEAG